MHLWLLEYFLPFILVLTVLVFIHEFGHFWVARKYGVKVEAFSIGFGPELFGFTDKKGTRWRFSVIPLGGYVKMFGDADVSSSKLDKKLKNISIQEMQQTLHSKTPWQRIMVAFAGPLANYLLAILLMVLVFWLKGVPFTPPTIGNVLPDMPAHKAGIIAGDKIIQINQEKIENFIDIAKFLRTHQGQDIVIKLERDGKDLDLSIPLYERQADGTNKPLNLLGVSPAGVSYKTVSYLEVLKASIWTPIQMSIDTLIGIGRMIAQKQSSKELGGILAIGDMAAKSTHGGIFMIMWFMAILSVNLGLVNLLPIPVLDGGQIMMHCIEAIRGKPLSEKVQEYIFMIGVALVLSIMLMSTWNDLNRYNIFQMISGWWK